MRDYAVLINALKAMSNTNSCFYCQGEHLVCEANGCILSNAADAIEELLAAVPHWISVEERLPEDFQKVLVFWWEHSEPMVDTAFWQKDAKRFDGEHWVRMEDKVTHWMPLPAPPKGGNHDN